MSTMCSISIYMSVPKLFKQRVLKDMNKRFIINYYKKKSNKNNIE